MARRLLLVLACALLLCACRGNGIDEGDEFDGQIQPEEHVSVLFSLEPLIDGFHGELFGDRDITAGGYFTGFERLDWFGAMIYANDDSSIIWRDRDGDIFRLDSRGSREQIGGADLGGNIIAEPLVYSNGYLYFARGNPGGVYVFRYDIGGGGFAKIKGFRGVEIAELALAGRYLYVQAYNMQPHVSGVRRPDDRVDIIIARIDLYTLTAVVVYSHEASPEDFDRIGALHDLKFIDNRLIMPVRIQEKVWDAEINPPDWRILRTGTAINITTVDMRNFETLIEIENEMIWSGIELYDGYIFFTTGESGLSRVNMNTGEREVLHGRAMDFSIDGDFLYYRTWDEWGRIYRVLLDYTHEINFDTAVLVYSADGGYEVSGWSVHRGYLYASLRTEWEFRNEHGRLPGEGKYRIRLFSENEPFLFYEIY